MGHDNMGYAAGYQAGLDAAKSQGSTPVQGQLTKEQELRQMQKNKSNVNSAYTPPQNYVHSENQHAETPVGTETIASPAETPVSTGTVETPKMEVEPAPSSGGFFWMFTSFIFFASIAAVLGITTSEDSVNADHAEHREDGRPSEQRFCRMATATRDRILILSMDLLATTLLITKCPFQLTKLPLGNG